MKLIFYVSEIVHFRDDSLQVIQEKYFFFYATIFLNTATLVTKFRIRGSLPP